MHTWNRFGTRGVFHILGALFMYVGANDPSSSKVCLFLVAVHVIQMFSGLFLFFTSPQVTHKRLFFFFVTLRYCLILARAHSENTESTEYALGNLIF